MFSGHYQCVRRIIGEAANAACRAGTPKGTAISTVRLGTDWSRRIDSNTSTPSTHAESEHRSCLILLQSEKEQANRPLQIARIVKPTAVIDLAETRRAIASSALAVQLL
jgi:hypothetical protein